jgi:hypothetical protein
MVAYACTGDFGEATNGAVVAQWQLVADGSGALVDPLHPELRGYPNPREVAFLDVTLHSGGKVCASDGARRWCGGPVQGIPYLVRGRVQSDELCLRVVDLFDQDVAEHCGLTPIAGDETLEPECHEAATAAGIPCSVCTDERGRVLSNTCTTDGEFGGEDTSCADPFVAARLGTDLFVRAFNDALGRAGITGVLGTPPDTELMEFDEGSITLGTPSCADVLDYLDDEFADDHMGTDDFVFGPDAIAECVEDGRCRIGQLVTRSMADACATIPAGCNLDHVSRGVIGSGGFAISALCPGDEQSQEFTQIEDCVGSPLVLDLDGDGIALTAASDATRFALLGGDTVPVGWLAGSDDALLAIDLDGDGAITKGWELFGEATGGGAADGFAALARRDTDRDGRIAGTELHGLLAWVDDGDATSEPGELHALDAIGIVALPLDAHSMGVTDASGAELGAASEAILGDGSTRALVDVWFPLGS